MFPNSIFSKLEHSLNIEFIEVTLEASKCDKSTSTILVKP